MKRFSQEHGQSEVGAFLLGTATIVVGIIAVICLIGFLGAFKSTDSGEICVVREGGMFDGKAVTDVRQPGEGLKNIGIWNHQDCLPATERDWVLSSNPHESDSGSVDEVSVPSSDAVNLKVDGQALFRLTTDPDKIKKFYKAFGRRKWDGESITSETGWINFLRIRFRPVLVDSLRQSIGSFRCVELNNACQYVQNAEETIGQGKVEQVNNSQNLAQAQKQISDQLVNGLRAALGDDYFEGVRFQNLRANFDPKVQARVNEAQAKRTEVATAKLEAQRQVEQAKGQTEVSRQQAEQIRLKSKSYKDNPAQAEIDKLRALCGEGGCQNLQVIGGSTTKLLSK